MKDRTPVFFALSLIVHIVIILLFYRKISQNETKTESAISDSLFYSNDYDNSTTNDSLFDEVETENARFYDHDSIDQEQSYFLQSELRRYYNEKSSGSTGPFMKSIFSGMVGDSILAMSELLRKLAIKQLLQQMNNTHVNVLPFDASSFEKWLREILSKQAADTNSPKCINELLKTIISDEELLNLWEQLVTKTIMEAGLDKIKTAMLESINAAKLKCHGRKPGDCPVSSFGNGGEVFGAEPDQDFIREFRKRFKEFSGPYLSLLASFMGTEPLERLLLDNFSLFSGLKESEKSPPGRKLTDQLDFKGMINESVSSQQKAAWKTQQFFNTFEHGFGKEISDMLSKDGLLNEEGNIAKNRLQQYADNYLKLVKTLSDESNCVVPDLELYARAALDIRNRRLKENGLYEIGRGIISQNTNEYFTIPELIYIKSGVPLKTQAVDTLKLLKPPFFTHAWGGSPRAEKPVIIDGNLDEWKDVYRYKLTGNRQGNLPLPQELQSCNYLLTQWDNEGLYFAYEINDMYDNAITPEAFWDTDALELFFDPVNYKDSIRINGRSFQFWVWPRSKRNRGYAGESVFHNPRQFEPRLLQEDLIQMASKRIGNRYTVEVRVNPLLIQKGALLPGKIIGFNYSINNGENVFIRWVTNKGINISGHPNLWGDLLLMGSSGQIKITPNDYILPGQSLKVLITDPDMNFSSKKRDKIIIKIRSRRTGDFLLCTCTETGNNTGVFFTSIETTFGLDTKEKRKLSVLPGDLLELYYLDQHASGGQVNIPVKQFVQVGRGMFSFTSGDKLSFSPK